MPGYPSCATANPAVRRASPRLSASCQFGWLAFSVSAIGIAAIVTRGCAYDVAAILRYSGYVLLHIALPGAAALYLAGMRPLSPSLLIALGLPLGFAIELVEFFALHALQLFPLFGLLPPAWLAAVVFKVRVTGYRPRLPAVARFGPIAGAMAGLVLLLTVVTASQMYAESPLVNALPQRPLFHDWMYLLSRAAVLKHMWPFEDPSLAGTPLQYHYFYLVHIAAASEVTGVPATLVFFRLAPVVLGVVFATQAYALGHLLTRSRAAGVLAAFLALVPGELSAASDYDHLVYLGKFLRWLYVSPTFFYGMVFFGALVIALSTVRRRWPEILVVMLLTAAATGAKGSVVPVLLVALLFMIPWQWTRERRFPVNDAFLLLVMSAAFLPVYLGTMVDWGTGDAAIVPFSIFRPTTLWNDFAVPCQRLLKRALHAPDFGTWLGGAVIGTGVLSATAGVRLLAVPYFCTSHAGHRARVARLLATVIIASSAFALTLHFDGDSELYFLLPHRLPLSILAAGFVSSIWVQYRHALAARQITFRCHALAGLAGAMVLVTTGCQVANTARCQLRGWNDWLHFRASVQINAHLVPLYATLSWLREHTEHNAVVISNAFTNRTLRGARGVEIDHTTAGVYYYYSALAERRMWIEGPTYLLNLGEVVHRLHRASDYFYDGRPLPRALRQQSVYVVVDHAVNDGARLPAADARPVFANARFEVFHLPGLSPARHAASGFAQAGAPGSP